MPVSQYRVVAILKNGHIVTFQQELASKEDALDFIKDLNDIVNSDGSYVHQCDMPGFMSDLLVESKNVQGLLLHDTQDDATFKAIKQAVFENLARIRPSIIKTEEAPKAAIKAEDKA